MALLAGQSVGLVDEIRPAADIVRETVEGAARILRGLSENIKESLVIQLHPGAGGGDYCSKGGFVAPTCNTQENLKKRGADRARRSIPHTGVSRWNAPAQSP